MLVLDEATSALDFKSSKRLMALIKTHCKGVTVLAIAHRLEFVADFDKILVLKPGGIVEAFDTPARLMKRPNSYFAEQMRREKGLE